MTKKTKLLIPRGYWNMYGIKNYRVFPTMCEYVFHIIFCKNVDNVRNSPQFLETYGEKFDCDQCLGLVSYDAVVYPITIFIAEPEIGIIAHEAFHAVKAFYMASHLKVPLADESNELFAYTIQELVKNIIGTIGKKRVIL